MSQPKKPQHVDPLTLSMRTAALELKRSAALLGARARGGQPLSETQARAYDALTSAMSGLLDVETGPRAKPGGAS